MPRFLFDAMLGDLARDVRLLGYDASYASHAADDVILHLAELEDRLLVTRDRALAARAGERGLFLGRKAGLDDLIERAHLQPKRVNLMTRCTDCGGELVAAEASRIPAFVMDHGGATRCIECGHLYWQGTHAAAIDRRLSRYFPAL